MFKFRIVIPNLKNREKDIVFVTKEEFPFEMWAKNMTAMVLLFHFEPLRPYEKMFPEPYGSTWKSLSSKEPLIQSAKTTATAHEEKLIAQEALVNQRKRLRKQEMKGILSDRVLPRIEIQNEVQTEILKLLSTICRKVKFSPNSDISIAYKTWTHNSSSPPPVLRTPNELLMPFSDALSNLEGSLGGSKGLTRLIQSLRRPAYFRDNKNHLLADSDPFQVAIFDSLGRLGISEGYGRTACFALQQNLMELKNVMETRREFTPPEGVILLSLDKDDLRAATVRALTQWCVDFICLNVPFDALPSSLSISATQMTVASANSKTLSHLPNNTHDHAESSMGQAIPSTAGGGDSSAPQVNLRALQTLREEAGIIMRTIDAHDSLAVSTAKCMHEMGLWVQLKQQLSSSNKLGVELSLRACLDSCIGKLQGDISIEAAKSSAIYDLEGDLSSYKTALASSVDEVANLYSYEASNSVDARTGSTFVSFALGSVTLPSWKQVDVESRMFNERERVLLEFITSGSPPPSVSITLYLSSAPFSPLSAPNAVWLTAEGSTAVGDAVLSRALSISLLRDLIMDSGSYDVTTTLTIALASAQVALGQLSSAKDLVEMLDGPVKSISPDWVVGGSASTFAAAANNTLESKDEAKMECSTTASKVEGDNASLTSTSFDESVTSESAGKNVALYGLGEGGVIGDSVFEAGVSMVDLDFIQSNEYSALTPEIRQAILNTTKTAITVNQVSHLPSRKIAHDIQKVIRNNKVTFIKGETGSGKTTQVPRLILEDAAASSDKDCLIICSQPRRLAATSVAARVADECGVLPGDLIGHQVRYDCARSPSTRIVFMTHGILLRRLASSFQTNDGKKQGISQITHIIIDEVHERSVDVDLLLLMLARSASLQNSNFKIVLMSASIDANVFIDYFKRTFSLMQSNPTIIPMHKKLISSDEMTLGSCFIPGRTFPVERFFALDIVKNVLPDVVKESKSVPKSVTEFLLQTAEQERKQKQKLANLSNNSKNKKTLDIDDNDEENTDVAGKAEFEEMAKMLRKQHQEESKRVNIGSNKDDEDDEDDEDELTVEDVINENDLNAAVEEFSYTDSTNVNGKTLSSDDKLHVDIHGGNELYQVDALTKWIKNNTIYFISRLIEYAHVNERKDGSILVFVQGTAEIDQVINAAQQGAFFKEPHLAQKLYLLPCHAQLPREKQALAFQPPPAGMRKVVVATNVAETSITIDDVVVVIDNGLHKSMIYDGHSRTNELTTCFISQSSAQQRAGRAGRVRSGKCFSLLHSNFLLNCLPQNDEPEICCVSLESHALLVKRMFPCEPLESIFSSCITPPASITVSATCSRLKSFAALDGWERLTPWGVGLSELPLEVPIARSVLMGVVLGCGGPVLAAATSAQEYLFSGGVESRDKAQAALKRASDEVGAHCDFLAKVRLLEDANNAKNLKVFCQETALNPQKIRQVTQLHKSLVQTASESSIIRALLALSPSSVSSHLPRRKVESILRNTETRRRPVKNSSIPHVNEVRAAIASGIAPQIAATRWSPRYAETSGGAQLMDPEAKDIKYSVPTSDPLINLFRQDRVNLLGFRTPVESIYIHPSSVSFSYANSKYLVAFLNKLKTTKLFMECTTRAPSTAILLGASDLEIVVESLPKADGKPTLSPRLVVDGWHDFKCAGAISTLLRQLRSALWTAKLTTIAERSAVPGLGLGIGAASSWRDGVTFTERQKVIETVLSVLRIEEGMKQN